MDLAEMDQATKPAQATVSLITQRITDCDNDFVNLTGYGREELLALNFTSLAKYSDPNHILECYFQFDQLVSDRSTSSKWTAPLASKNTQLTDDYIITATYRPKQKGKSEHIEALITSASAMGAPSPKKRASMRANFLAEKKASSIAANLGLDDSESSNFGIVDIDGGAGAKLSFLDDDGRCQSISDAAPAGCLDAAPIRRSPNHPSVVRLATAQQNEKGAPSSNLPHQSSSASAAAGGGGRKQNISTTTKKSAPKLSVLVVDDSKMSLKIMERMILRIGHNVTCASDGEEALNLLKVHTFDIVLMDINMPNMNGLEASHEFRKLEKEKMVAATAALELAGAREDRSPRSASASAAQPHQMIVAISGDISNTIFHEVSNAGFDAFIPKPLTDERFMEIVEAHKQHHVR